MTRADFTVNGADVASLRAEANAMLAALCGAEWLGTIESMEIHVDSRSMPDGTVLVWRADVHAAIARRPPDYDEEPF